MSTKHAAVEPAVEVQSEQESSVRDTATMNCFHPQHCQVRLERYQHRLRALALQLSLTAQHERRRIAVGLHDQIGQSLAGARLKLEALRPEATRNGMSEAIDEVVAVLAETIQSVRKLTFDLSPPLLYEFGLEAAVSRLAEHMGSHYDITVRLDCDEEQKPLPSDSPIVVYEVVRELLHNVVKHAEARRAWIGMTRAGENLRVEVADDGIGFKLAHEAMLSDSLAGFGLFSARERVLQAEGTLDVKSEPGKGTRVVLTVPLASGAAEAR